MKRISMGLLGIALCVFAVARSYAAQEEEEVNRMEDRRYEAMVNNDFATLDALLADDLTYTHSTAVLDSKASFIDTLKSGKLKYNKFDREGTSVRVYGNTAVVIGSATVQANVKGEDRTAKLRFTNVWVRKDKGWQLVAWEATPISAPK